MWFMGLSFHFSFLSFEVLYTVHFLSREIVNWGVCARLQIKDVGRQEGSLLYVDEANDINHGQNQCTA